ncbi:LOW QUALITY PROTEIN: uncharacterized protein LOC117531908 [Thalassophryne amazonica]|uniref:LOW QUALITY PROTEIN: uncharacterized protein LOC117531908 n=1 Tax=Thalassophryne amazonica TaxID=390379 RepID=UPI001471C5BF|nr:LOW QUALITY PROTEIN: uncharacterized protein LOC117531908 [Thalassophryne amazonica]
MLCETLSFAVSDIHKQVKDALPTPGDWTVVKDFRRQWRSWRTQWARVHRLQLGYIKDRVDPQQMGQPKSDGCRIDHPVNDKGTNDCAQPRVRGIHLHYEMTIRVRLSEDGSGSEPVLKLGECGVGLRSPLKGGFGGSECSEGSCHLTESADEMLNKKNLLTFGAWNVRTLLDRENTVRPHRRTALIAGELERYGIDIAALSETSLADDGSICEPNGGYTFFWKGKEQQDDRIHGVGFAIRSTLLSKLPEVPVGINECLIKLRIPLSHARHLTIISAYAPTLNSSEDDKESFYENLDSIVKHTPRGLIILGNFNTRVGQDHESWEGVLGTQGVGKMNSSGLLLLTMCAENRLTITNTLFRLPTKYKTLWMHPRSKQWHLIDYVIVRKRDIRDVHITRAMRGAECWTDHRLIRSTFCLHIAPVHHKKTKSLRTKFNTSKLKQPAVKEQFQSELENAVSAHGPLTGTPADKWNQLRVMFTEAAEHILGPQKCVHQDWFDDNDQTIATLLKEKHAAFVKWQNDISSVAKQDGFKSRVKFKGSYAECKTPGGTTKPMRVGFIGLTSIWVEEAMPEEFCDAIIISLFKNKGSKADCGNYCGMLLLSIAGKILARIILNRLITTISEETLPETQCGFRPNRSTMDMIFSIRQIQEKCTKQHLDLYMVFIDLTKAFDTVNREALWLILEKLSCLNKMIRIICLFHDGMVGSVLTRGGTSAPFAISNGVKQGCVLAPVLFNLFSCVLNRALCDLNNGVYLRYRLDGSLFNLRRLVASTKTTTKLIQEALFADDCALMVHTESDLQTLTESFSQAARLFGLSAFPRTKLFTNLRPDRQPLH